MPWLPGAAWRSPRDPKYPAPVSPQIAVARSALIVPLLFREDDRGMLSPRERAGDFLGREVTDLKGRQLPLWTRVEGRVAEIAELEPAFRSVLAPASAGSASNRWSAEHLRLTDDARTRLFVGGGLFRRLQRDKKRPDAPRWEAWADELRVEQIDLVLFPLDTAMLVVRLDWKRGRPLDVDGLCARLSAARHLRLESHGWGFGKPEPDVSKMSPEALDRYEQNRAARRAWFERTLGSELGPALDGAGPTGLEAIVYWLLGGQPAIELASARYVRHQTAVALETPFDDEAELDEALYHASRATTPAYGAPRDRDPDRVIEPYRNRRIALSREGTVSISWPSDVADVEQAERSLAYERDTWPHRFAGGGQNLGVYLLLCLHVRAQHLALQRLTARSLATAEALSDRRSLDDRDRRDELVELARLVALYDLTVATGDCGGVTEYSGYFRSLRAVLRIAPQLDETRAGVKALLELVDTAVERSRAELEQARSQRDREFQSFATDLGIIAVAFATVTGIMGANVPNLKMLAMWLAGIVVAWILGVRLLRWHQSNQHRKLDPETLKELVRPRLGPGVRRRLDVVWPGHPFDRTGRPPPAVERVPAKWSVEDDEELTPDD